MPLVEAVALPLVEPLFAVGMLLAEATTNLDILQSEVFYTVVVPLAEASIAVGIQ